MLDGLALRREALGGYPELAGYLEESTHFLEHTLLEHEEEIAEILFFLLAAMTIVELIDAHRGGQVATEILHRNKQHKAKSGLSNIRLDVAEVNSGNSEERSDDHRRSSPKVKGAICAMLTPAASSLFLIHKL